MQTPSLKQDALTSLQQLPEDSDLDEIIYRLYVIDKERKDREAVERSQVISHVKLKIEIEKW